MLDRRKLEVLFDWLLDGADGAPESASLLERLGVQATAAGIDVARAALFVRTLHPNLMGLGFVWRRGTAGVTPRDATFAVVDSDDYRNSPIVRVFHSGAELRCRLDGDENRELSVLDELRRDGLTDYLVLPIRFSDGEVHAIAYATDRASGFTDEELAALRRLNRPLAPLIEIRAMRRIAVSLLSAYVGRDAGERILRGQIQRGHTERIECVIWFSDLRDFTGLSSSMAAGELIELLNRIFDCQVPAVEKQGGEVLKYMGDGMLAIFPVTNHRPASDVCRRASLAARESFAALDQLNRARLARGERALGFGVSLHLGDVAYGNIGGASRLDFTCIGPAVNLASRIEGLTGKLGKRILLSEAFAHASPERTRLVGRFALKGVDGERDVYEYE